MRMSGRQTALACLLAVGGILATGVSLVHAQDTGRARIGETNGNGLNYVRWYDNVASAKGVLAAAQANANAQNRQLNDDIKDHNAQIRGYNLLIQTKSFDDLKVKMADLTGNAGAADAFRRFYDDDGRIIASEVKDANKSLWAQGQQNERTRDQVNERFKQINNYADRIDAYVARVRELERQYRPHAQSRPPVDEGDDTSETSGGSSGPQEPLGLHSGH
jgi:hypothetical protein